VLIQNHYKHESIQDDWGTRPIEIAPIPPVVMRAREVGYPVDVVDERTTLTWHATFYGMFAFQPGSSSRFRLPLPRMLERLPVAMQVHGAPQLAPIRKMLENMLEHNMPS
jgi:hypothetical protein